MLRSLIITLFYIMAAGLSSDAHAFEGVVKITFDDGKVQVGKLLRSPSEIKRMTLDKEKSGDQLVVTFMDDRHQVFVLQKPIASVTRIHFLNHEGQEEPAPAAALPSHGDKAAIHPGNVWRVREHCGMEKWTGIWNRRGTSLVFDAYFESSRGDRFTTEVEIVDVSGGKVKLFRRDKGAVYEGTLSRDMKRVINGWAPWYGSNCMPWSAVIE